MLWLHTRVVTSAVWRLAEVGRCGPAAAPRQQQQHTSSSTAQQPAPPASHGQGQPHPADQQHALPGQDGAVAALQVHRGVSVHSVVLFQIYDSANGRELLGRSCPPSAQPPVNMCPHCPILILQIFIFVWTMTVLKYQWVQSEVMIYTIVHISASNGMIKNMSWYCRMKAFIEENEKGDYLIHSPDKKINPWMEKVNIIYQTCHVDQFDEELQ